MMFFPEKRRLRQAGGHTKKVLSNSNTRTRQEQEQTTHKKYINYVENGMCQPHLSRKFKLRRFRMEIDCKNGAVLVSMVLKQIGKYRISKNNVIFQNHFYSCFLTYKTSLWLIRRLGGGSDSRSIYLTI